MKIGDAHSYFNGLEFLLVHKPHLWVEIQDIIATVDERVDVDRAAANTLDGLAELGDALRQVLLDNGWNGNPADGHRQIVFLKERVAIETQLGAKFSSAYDVLAKPLVLYADDQIDVGVEILPMKSLQSQMSSGVAYYESELYNVVRQGRGVPAVPLVLIGVEE